MNDWFRLRTKGEMKQLLVDGDILNYGVCHFLLLSKFLLGSLKAYI